MAPSITRDVLRTFSAFSLPVLLDVSRAEAMRDFVDLVDLDVRAVERERERDRDRDREPPESE